MDDYTIGLDFGTHQSKVCYEDASDPRNRVYTFLEFKPTKGKKTFFLPSIVQINQDKKLSYGFTDEKDALVTGYVHGFDEPVYERPEPPRLRELPKQPQQNRSVQSKTKYFAQFSKTITVGKGRKKKTKTILTIPYEEASALYKKYRESFESKDRIAYYSWVQECKLIESDNQRRLEEYEEECRLAEKEFEKKHKYWEKHLIEKKAIYRYFKIATFSKEYSWGEDIPAKVVSTWYLTYVLFTIFEQLPDNTPIQMGIPESIGDSYSAIQKKNAEDVFYTAYYLYRHFGSKKAFLDASYEELLKLTDFNAYKSIDLDKENWSQVLLLPEAFAGLLMASRQGKIGIGMTLLVDIGGGSTDLSLFNVIEAKNKREGLIPNVSRIISLHKGLNYIYSLYKTEHYDMSFEQIRKLFAKSPESFQDEIEVFRQELVSIVQDELYAPLYMAALRNGISKERVMPILRERPVVYSGGGGVYDVFHNRIHIFSETLSLSNELLSVKDISNKNISDEELSILAVAYGLSIPQMMEPDMTPLEKLFDHMAPMDVTRQQQSSYEHGLSDVE